MDVKYFELRAANKECKEKFSEIAKYSFKGIPIFEHACKYVNNSESYKRNGRKLEIVEIKDYSITVKLISETKLEMASKSLAGFTRELLRVDYNMNSDEESRFFRFFVYNNTLFRNVQIESVDIEIENRNEMSDVDALKKCVDLFCNNMTTTKEEAIYSRNMKKEIKKMLFEYERFVRINSYTAKMRGE